MPTSEHSNDSTAPPPIDLDLIDAGWFTRNRIRIAKFDDVFVLSYSKRVMERKTPLPWIAHPTSLDSRGYHATFDEFDGQTAAALYGAFLNLVKLSTLSPPYGSLAHSDGEPFKLPYIENRTRIPQALIIRAVNWFLRIGWLEVEAIPNAVRHASVMTNARQRHDHDTGRHDNEKERNDDETERNDTTTGDAVPAELLNVVDLWNTLADSNFVSHHANREPPAKSVLKAWVRSRRHPELKDSLAKLDEIEAAVRGSPFVHGAGWFRLEKLICGTNKEGTFILTKLLEGGFADSADHHRAATSNQGGISSDNFNRLSAAERAEKSNAQALQAFIHDEQGGIRESDDGALLSETNRIVYSSPSHGVVRDSPELSSPDDQPSGN